MPSDPLQIHLQVLAPSEARQVWFCTWCGERADKVIYAGSPTGPPCVHCGRSPICSADASVAPLVGAAFLTVDASGRIATTSRRAVRMLELPDDEDARGWPVWRALLDANTEGGDDILRKVIIAMACGQRLAHRMIVRQPGMYGVRDYIARMGVCHPPRATLIELTPYH